jgi:hypothetical protein
MLTEEEEVLLKQCYNEQEHGIDFRHPSAKDLSKVLSNFVNYNSSGKAHLDFIEHFRTEHNTLQQSTMRLFMAVIKDMAQWKYVDARNEGSVALAKKIVAKCSDNGDFYLSHI